MMYVVRPFHWYKVCQIWWRFVLGRMNLWWTLKNTLKISRNSVWSTFSRTVHAFSFCARLFLKPDQLRVLPAPILILPFPFVSTTCLHISHASFHFFLFFSLLLKSISHEIIVQIEWNFFFHDPCSLFNLMDIFAKIVHVWISVLARVCSCMFFHAPCLMFWSWNDDA